MTDPRLHERELDRLANDLAGSKPPSAPYDVPREDADTVRLFHSWATTPPPDAARERVWREVLATIDRPKKEDSVQTPTSLTVTKPVGFGHVQPSASERVPPWSPGRILVGGSTALGRLAIVAVLVIAAVRIYDLGWNRDSPRGGPNGISVPMPTASCGASGGAASPRVGTPVPVTLDEATPGAGTVDVSLVWSTGSPPAPGSTAVGYVAMDPQCRLWITDTGKNKFLIFDADGHELEEWGTRGSGDGEIDLGGNNYYGGIAFTSDGGFYVCDVGNSRIEQFDADRRFVRAWSTRDATDAGPGMPFSIAVGPDGNVYTVVGVRHGFVKVYSADGAFLRSFGEVGPGPGQVDGPGQLAFDPNGNLWTLVPGDADLVEFTATGEVAKTIDLSPIVEPFTFGFAIDPTGRLFVTNWHNGRIVVLGPDGTFLFAWGEVGTNPGQFTDPFSMAFDGNGGVYVVEKNVPRLQKFQLHK